MIIEVDLRYLSECRISVHQYVILKLVYEGNLKLLEKYLRASSTINNLREDLNHLYENEFVQSPPNENAILTSIVVSDKFIRLFQSSADSFEELYNAFPVRVLRPDGSYDYLRVDHKRSKLLYRNIVGSDVSKHQLLVNCLKLEVEDRSRRGQLPFMKRMPMWLSSEAWKVYADEDSGNPVSTPGEILKVYGTDIE
jgi:hypothetical protein